MLSTVNDTMDVLGSVDLFNQGGLAFLRDAWIAAEFSRLFESSQVRLIEGDWPDFEIKDSKEVRSFEATEADDPLRRRGDEFANAGDSENTEAGEGILEGYPVEEWIRGAEQAGTWIEIACAKKVSKNYSGHSSLVIYLNLDEFGIRESEVQGSFRHSTRFAKDHFDEVWVLWKGRIFRIWPEQF